MDYKTEIEDLILTTIREGASDLHLSEGRNPTVRVRGSLTPILRKPILTDADTRGFVEALIPPADLERFLAEKEIDFAYSYKNEARFRGNAFFQQGSVGVALRLIPRQIRTFAELGLPPVLADFASRKQGFFLVVGPVGQGKSTTLASMIEKINAERAEHIVTVEDPVEYLFEQKRSIIDQREVRVDTGDFHTALKSAFRQDVDVIMIGEMRNTETISTAVTAAETGHLVLSTLHTNNASQTIDRIIDSFPPTGQDQIRMQLAGSLMGVFSQRLIPRISGGMIPAYELLVNTPAVANLIRERRTHEINTMIETGLEQGMVDMNRSLSDLVRAGEITVEDARQHSLNPKVLDRMI